LSSISQDGNDGKGLKLANVFKFGQDIFQKIPQILLSIAFPGKLHLIFSFCFIRIVVALNQAPCFNGFSTSYEQKTAKLPRQCLFKGAMSRY